MSDPFIPCDQIFNALEKYYPFLQLGGGIIMRCAEEPAVFPEDVLNLNRRVFYMFVVEGRYKGKSEFTEAAQFSITYPNLRITECMRKSFVED